MPEGNEHFGGVDLVDGIAGFQHLGERGDGTVSERRSADGHGKGQKGQEGKRRQTGQRFSRRRFLQCSCGKVSLKAERGTLEYSAKERKFSRK